MPKQDMLNPTPQLLIKVGSLVVHYQEWTSGSGHPHDKIAIDTLEQDPEVIDWFAQMTKAAFLPVKR
jgi:hypothetical protein